MKQQRIWATTTPEIYERLLKATASNITREGKKMPIGEFVEQAVIEKLNRIEHEYSKSNYSHPKPGEPNGSPR